LARAAADLATEVSSSVAPPPTTASVAPAALSAAAVAAAPATPATPSVAPTSVVRGSTDAALEQLLQSGRAVKVAIKRSTRDDELYVLRRADGHSGGLGTRQAVLVLLEPDPEFFEKSENAKS
jgi:hypothetical protein